MLAALATTAVGVLVLWLPRGAPVRLAGLALSGLGVANLYPATLALTLDTVPARSDTANARVQLLLGGALMAAPFALGALADRVGIQAAFALVPALLVVAVLLLRALRRRLPGA